MKGRNKASPVRLRLMMILAVIMGSSGVISSVPNTNVTSVLCNAGVYTRGDPFATSLAYVLSELEEVTPSRKGYDYYSISPFPNAFAYGHATCGGNISNTDCASCLSSATKTMTDTCSSRVGARAVLYDCSIRYEKYPFTS